MMPLRMLTVTTSADLSLNLFYDPLAAELIEPSHISYQASEIELNSILSTDFEYIYFRDPYNDSKIEQKQAEKNTKKIIKKYPNARMVDSLKSYEDMFFEDKWRQYQLFSELMPKTALLESLNIDGQGTNFIKKRISARSKGVIFSSDDFPENAEPKEYLVQPMVRIEEEYRVYVVGGKIISPLAVKSSKTAKQATKVIGLSEVIDPEVKNICEIVHRKTKYDFMGLDIVKTDEGYVLLEVNRSCQFEAYYRLTGLNLAILLNQYLTKAQL